MTRITRLTTAGVLLGGLLGLSAPAQAASGVTTRVSVDSAGAQANWDSYFPALSADGRIVAFESIATNLVAGDTNDTNDVFVHDRKTGQTTRVSVNSAGDEANQGGFAPSLSGDGRIAAFLSGATNLGTCETGNNPSNVFVHDRQTGQTTCVSVDSTGNEGNRYSSAPTLSASGRVVAFTSAATNLVAGDTNDTDDVFVHDRQTGQTTRVTVNSAGTQANNNSEGPALNADGRVVAFASQATNLGACETNEREDVFVHDRKTGQTTCVSVDSAGNGGDSSSSAPTLSANGHIVAFHSEATNLVPDDTNGGLDVFVHDRKTGITTRVSVDSAGTQANGISFFPTLSPDGRFVAFLSEATNLVPDDTNNTNDVFVHDRKTGITTRVSVDSAGGEANGRSLEFPPALSADGRVVAFSSIATNLVAGDTNEVEDVFVHRR